MSYKYTVLQDNPVAFYLLDEVRSGSVGSYVNLISSFATYQDLKDHGVSYSSISGLPIYDYSGNLNNGYAIGASSKQLMPLISGGIRGTEILSDTAIYFASKGIANKYYSDNAFTIEAWCVISNSSDIIPIVGDIHQNIGVFHKNGNVVFMVGNYSVEHTVSTSESIYIVGKFNGDSISLYINGQLVEKLSIGKYKFTNEVVDFQSGPSASKMIIDCVGFYKFNLSDNQIKSHYDEGIKELYASQIVNTNGGYLFSMNTASIKPKFKYSYPYSKKWQYIIPEGITLSNDGSYIYIKQTDTQQSVSYSFVDSIIVPQNLGITTSQIYWSDDVNGIQVEVSLDNQSWQTCINGNPLPYFNKNDNQVSDLLYIRITLSSTDTAKYLPVLKYLNIMFYSSKNFYSDNSGLYLTSNYDYSLPEFNYRILSYNKNNGLKMLNGHGFSINNAPSTKAIELIFTPASGENVLVSAQSKSFRWDSDGLITKSGVASIYVNGINRTSETNIWDFLILNVPHHIVINFTSEAVSMKFNQNQDDSKYGLGSMYNNLAIYPEVLSEATILNHYLMYTDNIIKQVDDSLINISESNLGDDNTAYTLTSIEPQSISL
jgi:hypothetical protein